MKRVIIIIRKYFNLENFASLYGKVYETFLSFGLESSISQKIRNFLRVAFFIFRAQKVTS